MGKILNDYFAGFVITILICVPIFFIVRPPPRGRKLVRGICIGVLVLLASPVLLLGLAFGGIRGLIGAIIELLIMSGVGVFIPACLVASRIGNHFGAIFDGGNEPPEAHPFYYIAKLKRSERKYDEAITRVEEQLKRFPSDFEGQMLLAEIQAEDLHDLPAAQNTIETLAHQKHRQPEEIALAFQKLAEWHLQIGQDQSSARAALMKIIELLPNSEPALLADGKLSHPGE